MSPALQTSAAMLVRRQLAGAQCSTSSIVLAAANRLLVAQQYQRRGYATPMGPPPKDFRISKRLNWAKSKESTLDRLGKYFLLTEMARGMYVLFEQFFRPPYVEALQPNHDLGRTVGIASALTTNSQIYHLLSFRKGRKSPLLFWLCGLTTTHFKSRVNHGNRVPSLRVSVVNTPFDDTPLEKSDALPASFARL